MKIIIIYVSSLFILSSCSAYRYSIRSQCLDLSPNNFIQTKSSPTIYNKKLEIFINYISRDPVRFVNGYENDKNKPQGLCKNLYVLSSNIVRNRNMSSIPPQQRKNVFKKYSRVYKNIFQQEMNSKVTKRHINPCDSSHVEIDSFIRTHNRNVILGTKGMDISDKKSYARGQALVFKSNLKKCDRNQIDVNTIFNKIYNTMRIKIETVTGCESFAKNLSKSALESELAGDNPTNDPLYRAYYADYQQCLNYKRQAR